MWDLSILVCDFMSFLDCSKSTPYPTDSLFLYHFHYFFVNGQTPLYYQHIRHDCRTDNERVKMKFKAISIVICSRYMIQFINFVIQRRILFYNSIRLFIFDRLFLDISVLVLSHKDSSNVRIYVPKLHCPKNPSTSEPSSSGVH